MGNGHVLAGHDTARVPQTVDNTDRNQRARDNLQWLAPDDHELLADMLGLTSTPRRVSTMPLTEPGDGAPRGRHAKGVLAAHGTYSRYQSPCHCDPCDQAGRDYRDDLKLRRTAAR